MIGNKICFLYSRMSLIVKDLAMSVMYNSLPQQLTFTKSVTESRNVKLNLYFLVPGSKKLVKCVNMYFPRRFQSLRKHGTNET